ncbi:hypothetical protein [Candidatus Ornithobacterium hominis]|nr:hypothetical protein [Candidatus Ornithobacterium hominis]
MGGQAGGKASSSGAYTPDPTPRCGGQCRLGDHREPLHRRG